VLQIGTEWRQSIWSLGSNDKGTCTLYTKAIGRKENRPIERRVTRVFSERIRRRAIIKYQISWISRNFKITHVNLPAGLTKYASIYICIHTHIHTSTHTYQHTHTYTDPQTFLPTRIHEYIFNMRNRSCPRVYKVSCGGKLFHYSHGIPLCVWSLDIEVCSAMGICLV